MYRILTMLILLTGFAMASAQKIYFVEYENQAGWKTKEKMHLMF